jgi:hypothetical protein
VPNPDGVLEPGERALLRLDVGFTNQNTVAQFAPPIGTYGSGTIRGFGSAWIDLVGSGQPQGEWDLDPIRGFGVALEWDISGHEGTPTNGGSAVSDIQMGQFPDPPGALDPTNPIREIWRGVWTPADFGPRTVRFDTRGNGQAGQYVTSVFLRLNGSLAAAVYCPTEFGSVGIPVAPAPPALGVLALAAAFWRPRR